MNVVRLSLCLFWAHRVGRLGRDSLGQISNSNSNNNNSNNNKTLLEHFLIFCLNSARAQLRNSSGRNRSTSLAHDTTNKQTERKREAKHLALSDSRIARLAESQPSHIGVKHNNNSRFLLCQKTLKRNGHWSRSGKQQHRREKKKERKRKRERKEESAGGISKVEQKVKLNLGSFRLGGKKQLGQVSRLEKQLSWY